MARYKKFIIVKDWNGVLDLRLGYPIYHKDLMENKDEINHAKCVGGGFWDLDIKNKKIVLWGDSSDFGKPKKEDVKKSLESWKKSKWFYLESWTKSKWFYFSWLCERIADEEFPEYDSNIDLNEFTFDIGYYE